MQIHLPYKNPDEVLAGLRLRLQRRAFIEAAIFGMASLAAACFLLALIHAFISFSVLPPSPAISAVWMAGAILLCGLCSGLINARASKFPMPLVAHTADRVFPASCGRFTAWVELQEKLPRAWKSAMHGGMVDYLSGQEMTPLPWPDRRMLPTAALVVLLALAGSISLLSWRESRTNELKHAITDALTLVQSAKDLILANGENPVSELQNHSQDELRELVEQGSRRVQESGSARDAESMAAAVLKEVERRILENRNDPSPTARAAATETGTDTTVATSKPGGTANSDIARGLPSSQPTAAQDLLDMPDAPQNQNDLVASGPAHLDHAQTFPADAGSLASDAGAEEAGTLVVPESLPERTSGTDTTGPAILPASDLPTPDALTDMATNLAELRLPSDVPSPSGGEPGALLTVQKKPEDADVTGFGAGEGLPDWDAVIEDVQSQDVPIGSRETVRRYFEILSRDYPPE